jgi:hypothetical protein
VRNMACIYIMLSSRMAVLIYLLVLQLAPVMSLNCPLGMDPLCTSCNAADECIACQQEYFPKPNPSEQQCFPCAQGCLLCSSSISCTKCLSEGFYMEQGYCWPCKSGCTKCADEDNCQECEDQYFAVKGNCTLLKVQVYIVIACLGALLILITTCCYALIKVKAKSELNETFYSHIQNKSLMSKTVSVNILDDDAKKDATRIHDLDTIGKIRRGDSVLKLSFIESKSNKTVMEEEGIRNKRRPDYSRSFLVD